jgi:hypothetical protein
MRHFIAATLAASIVSWAAAAQPPAPQSQPSGTIETVPALVPGHEGDIGFVSGGTSLDDRASLRGIAGAYNLRLTFAVQPSGAYLAGIGVKLADANGRTLLDTVSDGPLFYAHVPPGRYRVTVTDGAQSQTSDLDVAPTSSAAQAFYWRQAG